MYSRYFEFKERPFKLVPNPEYYYLSRSHEEALAHLTYALDQGDGFVEITGEVGTGKTTLCRVFLDSLDDTTEVAYIFNPKLGPRQLLKAINDEFGIRSRSDDTKDLIDALNAYLIRMKVAGRRVLILIDEAHNLERTVMEQLRLLSNLETSRSKLLQIILVGQPELSDKLDSHELRQLSQRISLRCHLTPLSAAEVREYIDHRLHVASVRPAAVRFTPWAYRSVYRYSGGIPRLINIVCDRSLLTAYSRGRKKIGRSEVRAAVRELSSRGQRHAPSKLQLKKPAAALTAVCLAILALIFYREAPLSPVDLVRPLIQSGRAGYENTATEAAVNRINRGVVGPAEALDSDRALGEFLKEMDVRSARNLALATVFESWGVDGQIDSQLDALTDDLEYFQRACARKGFSLLQLQCRWAMLEKLGLPAVAAVRLPDVPQTGFLTVETLDRDLATLSRARYSKAITISTDTLQSWCAGAVYVPWKDYIGEPEVIPQEGRHESIARLKRHLRECGFAALDERPEFDEATAEAVKMIQRKYGLRPDGIVGPLTKIVLYNENPQLTIPRLGAAGAEARHMQADRNSSGNDRERHP